MADDIKSVTEDASKEYEQEIADLKKQVAKLTKSLSKQTRLLAEQASEEGSDFYDSARQRGAQAARVVGRNAQITADTVKENPAIALAVLTGVGILLAIFLGRRD